MNLLSKPWFALLFFGILVLATRYPQAPGQLFTFDDVNLAYSVNHFDIRISQPQPPGYPLFVFEMRVLHWLRFRRPDSILLFLALTGSIGALVLLSQFGRLFFGGLAGFFAACLLVFHPVFWHSGIASALRVQLAGISIAVGWSCWRAWTGDRKWVLWSAFVLGLCAGVRPEIGPLLLPLWAVSAWRAGAARSEWLRAIAAMTFAVMLWLIPATIASGGPIAYAKANLDYIADQGSVSSGLFGAVPDKWQTTFWRLIVWTCCGLLSWTLPAVLAWKRKQGWDVSREKLAFLALWFLPPFLFAIFVHVEDPGQSLAMAPPVALFGGFLFNRALDNWSACVSRWETVTLVVAAIVIYWLIEFRDTTTVAIWVPPIALAAGLFLKFASIPNSGYLPPIAAMAFLLTPLVIEQFSLFYNDGWYYRGNGLAGQILEDLNSGLALTSLDHIKRTLAVDDHSLRQAIRLAAERPGKTVVVWEQGLVAWRKAGYYLHGVPIVVLDRKKIRSGAPPSAAIWTGAHLDRQLQGDPPLGVTLPAGGRIVWLLNPATAFFSVAGANFPLTPAGPIYYTDLPASSGSKTLGDYKLEW